MHFHKLGLTLLFVISLYQFGKSQYKSFDFGINASSISDDYKDQEYLYDSYSGVRLAQFKLGYTFSLNNKFTLSARVAYAPAFSRYFKRQLSVSVGSLDDRTYIEKNQKSVYLKSGIALAYWVSNVGKGLYLEAELQNLTLLSAKSREKKRVNSENIEEYTIDYSEIVKNNVPSLRLGVGFNLPINRIALFIRFGLDLRMSTYFKSTDNFTFINRSLGFGFRYVLQNNKKDIIKD